MPKSHHQVDWKNNWHASLATKITGPILWVIVLVSIVIAIIAQRDTRQELEDTFINNADKAAYQVGILLSENNLKSEQLKTYLQQYIDLKEFTAITVHLPQLSITLGEIKDEFIHLERPILYSAIDSKNMGEFFIIVYQQSIDSLVKEKRKQALLGVGVPFIGFGFILAIMIHVIITRPILNIVSATRKVSEGDMSIRLEAKRIDELGELEKFFNRMLDTLEQNHIEMKNAFESAKSASNAKSVFLANMSHELRTPLNAIMGYTSLIEEFLGDNGLDQCIGDTQRIQHSAKHLLNLINDVLDLSKIEAGKLVICPESFEIFGMLNDVMDLTTPILYKNNNKFELKVDKSIGTMRSDETKIHQVMLNLLSNAAKFTHDGIITINSEKFMRDNVEVIRFSVSDNGIGMTPEQQDKIFQDFVQADLSTTKKYGGTGLGLSITKRFCEILGGAISVRSEKDKGSTFTVELPVTYRGHNITH